MAENIPLFASNDAAIAWFRERVPMTDSEVQGVKDRAKERAFWAAGAGQISQVQTLQRSLTTALEKGQSLQGWRRDARVILSQSSRQHLDTVFRTNIQSAYSAGRQQQMYAPANIRRRPYGYVQTVSDSRRSKICSGFAGTIMPLDDPGWATRMPPYHHNCRTTIRTLTARDAERRGGETGWPPTMPAPGFGSGTVQAAPVDPAPVEDAESAEKRKTQLDKQVTEATKEKEAAELRRRRAEDAARKAEQKQLDAEALRKQAEEQHERDVARKAAQAAAKAEQQRKDAEELARVAAREKREAEEAQRKADAARLQEELKAKHPDTPVEQKRVAVGAMGQPERAEFYRARAVARADAASVPLQPNGTSRVKEAVYSRFVERPKFTQPPKTVDGAAARSTETLAEYETSHDALRAFATEANQRTVLRGILRHHTGATSRDVAKGLPGKDTIRFQEKDLDWRTKLGVDALHEADGTLILSAKRSKLVKEATALIQRGKAQNMKPEHWESLNVLVHEEYHSSSPQSRLAYRNPFGRNTEEAFTEILARKTTRQIQEDVYGASQIMRLDAPPKAGQYTLTALPRTSEIGKAMGTAYSDIIGDLVDAFDGDVELLEQAIVTARAADQPHSPDDPKGQMRAALSILPKERADRIMSKLEALWK